MSTELTPDRHIHANANAGMFERAKRSIPGGVNSPVRAFKAVGGTPIFISKAQGAYMWDVQGQRYVDFIGSWGPMILGHAHPEVVEAVQKACVDGFSYGAPTLRETELAEEILKWVPSADQIRLVSSGTEAAMSAIRLARGFTGKNLFIKFEGCYHGHADPLLVKAGSGLATFGHPTSAGVPTEVAQHTLVLPYNDILQLEQAFDMHGKDLACVIIEPIAGNMNFVRASIAFMQRLWQLCTQHKVLLVLDEVMTGFRVALGGAQSIYAQHIPGFKADLTIFGKVIGGGMPLAAFAGSKDIMQHLAPDGPTYQAGTLSGNPVATACGLTTLKILQRPGLFEQLSQRTQQWTQGLCQAAKKNGLPLVADSQGGMFGFFFADELPQNYPDVMAKGNCLFNTFFHGMLEKGIYLAPAMYEAGFVSAAHTTEDIEFSIAQADKTFQALLKNL